MAATSTSVATPATSTINFANVASTTRTLDNTSMCFWEYRTLACRRVILTAFALLDSCHCNHTLDLGTCTCDLTANKCDAAARCTCDPDCTAADLAIFAAAAAVASPASYLFNPPALPNVRTLSFALKIAAICILGMGVSLFKNEFGITIYSRFLHLRSFRTGRRHTAWPRMWPRTIRAATSRSQSSTICSAFPPSIVCFLHSIICLSFSPRISICR